MAGDDRLEVRVAINCGEVRLENNDVFGEPVNIASRVEGLAGAGEVYLTESVYLAMNKAEVPSEEVGLFDLKGIPGKIRIFKVPHAPYQVAPVASQTPPAPLVEDLPPYGNLGLSKMPEAAGAELTARAAELTARAVHGGEELVKRAVHEMGAIDTAGSLKVLRRGAPIAIGFLALVLVFWGGRWLATSSIQRAVEAVENAPAAEKNTRIEAALKLLAEEKNLGQQQYWSGRLQETRDDSSAIRHYKSAVQQGNSAAEDRLVSLIDHRRCEWRVGALQAVGELKLIRAKSRVEALAATGGPDDGQRVLFLGCNSKSEAAAVLRKLE